MQLAIDMVLTDGTTTLNSSSLVSSSSLGSTSVFFTILSECFFGVVRPLLPVLSDGAVVLPEGYIEYET
jgi:hypothetical protein